VDAPAWAADGNAHGSHGAPFLIKEMSSIATDKHGSPLPTISFIDAYRPQHIWVVCEDVLNGSAASWCAKLFTNPMDWEIRIIVER
jgi:hypothetical protein